jgi:hypothetical protein
MVLLTKREIYMDLVFSIVGILFFFYSVIFSFFWWFKSKEYVTANRKRREEYRKKFFFMPQVLLFDFYDQNSRFEMWVNRVVGLIFLSASILAIVVGIHGPFKIR